jgi:hypothetical protein
MKNYPQIRIFNALVVLAVIFGSSLLSANQAAAMGRGRSAAPTVTPTPVPITGVAPIPVIGAPSCVSSDPNHICIGLKIVSYVSNNIPILTEAQAITLVNGINTIWRQCNIAFQLETFEQSNPTTVGLSYSTDWKNDGDTVRNTYNDGSTFLVVTVGSLTGATIGVTEMPGAGSYGSLIEAAYAQNPLTVGHELGHYQGLYHVSDSTNLMNPYIGSNTSALTASQCSTARSTDQANWTAMMRY